MEKVTDLARRKKLGDESIILVIPDIWSGHIEIKNILKPLGEK